MTASASSASRSSALSASTASGGRKRRLAPVSAALPASVAWLEGLTLDMAAVSAAGSTSAPPPPFRACAAIQYQLRASYDGRAGKTPAAAWTVQRSFQEYVQFQKRLMRSMRKGHACGAECKWLYGVVKNHFPKASLFCTRCPDRVEARRKAMLRVLTTVQASLLNRGNHRCAVFVNEVSREFAAFVMAGSCELSAEFATPTPSSSEATASPSRSLAFDSDESSDEEEELSPADGNSPKVCSFCGCGREHEQGTAC